MHGKASLCDNSVAKKATMNVLTKLICYQSLWLACKASNCGAVVLCNLCTSSTHPYLTLPALPLMIRVECLLQGIMHRDIKPENLLLSEEYEVKLADFGLAINVDAQSPISRVGTLDYMAPEVGLPFLCFLFVPLSHLSCAYCTGVLTSCISSIGHTPTALEFPLWIVHPLLTCLLRWTFPFGCFIHLSCAYCPKGPPLDAQPRDVAMYRGLCLVLPMPLSLRQGESSLHSWIRSAPASIV